MIRRWFRSLLVGGSELVLSLGLVLVLFLIITVILTFSFPTGTGLVDLYDDVVKPGATASFVELREMDEGILVAEVTEITRDVKERAADAITWNPARSGMVLGEQHAVQTMSRSAASIDFEGGGQLFLDEKSLVVVKRPERRRGRRGRGASLVVLGGRVRGVVGSSEKPLALEILTADSTTRIRPEGESPAEFGVTVNQDETSTLSVFNGTALVTAGGQTSEFGPNESVTVSPGQVPAAARIPGAPRASSPPDDSVHVRGPLASKVRFGWSEADGAAEYLLTIARDAQFGDVVHDMKLNKTSFAHGNLAEGEYYWRVRGLNGKVEGPPSAARSLRIGTDFEPPSLRVDLPDHPVGSPSLVVRGATEPGAEILIGGDTVEVGGDGAFEFAMTLRQGPNMIVVEAIDAVGNTAYHSQYVNAKF